MANHKSAVKRARQNLVRKVRNSSKKTKLKTVIKKLNETVASNDKAKAEEALRTVTSVISKGASQGTWHKKTAARKTSRLSKKVHAMAS